MNETSIRKEKNAKKKQIDMPLTIQLMFDDVLFLLSSKILRPHSIDLGDKYEIMKTR